MQRENKYKQPFARWLSQLDLRESDDFKDGFDEAEMERRMERNLYHHISASATSKTVRFPLWLGGIAASILLLGAAAGWFALRQDSSGNAQIVYQEVRALTGERKALTLSDGTKIFLNNSSSIRYAMNAGNERRVYLNGEAYFDVAHKASRPFIVYSGKLKVQVLGTSFNVRAYNSSPGIAVTVASGKVGVLENGKTKAWMLLPGEQLNYSRISSGVMLSKVTTDEYTGWTAGRLTFNDERLDQICLQLSGTYGVHFNIKNPALKSKRINLKVNNENIGTIVKMLGLAGKFSYSIREREITINQ